MHNHTSSWRLVETSQINFPAFPIFSLDLCLWCLAPCSKRTAIFLFYLLSQILLCLSLGGKSVKVWNFCLYWLWKACVCVWACACAWYVWGWRTRQMARDDVLGPHHWCKGAGFWPIRLQSEGAGEAVSKWVGKCLNKTKTNMLNQAQKMTVIKLKYFSQDVN